MVNKNVKAEVAIHESFQAEVREGQSSYLYVGYNIWDCIEYNYIDECPTNIIIADMNYRPCSRSTHHYAYI